MINPPETRGKESLESGGWYLCRLKIKNAVTNNSRSSVTHGLISYSPHGPLQLRIGGRGSAWVLSIKWLHNLMGSLVFGCPLGEYVPWFQWVVLGVRPGRVVEHFQGTSP